jgi:hypothetical protein
VLLEALDAEELGPDGLVEGLPEDQAAAFLRELNGGRA